MSDNSDCIIYRMEVSKRNVTKRDQKLIKAKISFCIKLYKYVLASHINHFYSFCQFTPLDEVRAGKSRHSPWFFPPVWTFLADPVLMSSWFSVLSGNILSPPRCVFKSRSWSTSSRSSFSSFLLLPPFSLSPSVCARSAKFGPSRLNVKNQRPRIARIAQRQLSLPPSPLLVSLSFYLPFPFFLPCPEETLLSQDDSQIRS